MDQSEEEASVPLMQEPEVADEGHPSMGTPPSSDDHFQRLSPSHQSIVRGIFFLLGIGILAPWNAFISAKDYFDMRLCGQDAAAGIENTFSVVYNLAGVLSLTCMVAVQAIRDKNQKEDASSGVAVEAPARLPVSHAEHDPLQHQSPAEGSTASTDCSGESSSSFWLVTIPLTIYCMAFFVQVILVVVPSKAFLPLTIGSLAVTAMAGSVAQVGIVATAAKFHGDIAMSPYLAGMSAGGLAISVANFAAAAWEDPSDYLDTHCATDPAVEFAIAACKPYTKVDWGAAGYFLLGCFTLVACIVGYGYIHRLQHEENEGTYDVVASASNAVEASPRIGLELRSQQLTMDDDAGEEREADGIFRQPSILSVVQQESQAEQRQHATLGDVWTVVWAPVVSVFLTFTVTLGLFPAWTSLLRSTSQCHGGRFVNDLFTPFSFVVFNAGDLVGRLLSAFVTEKRNLSPKLLAAAVIRFTFFLFFAFCASSTKATLFIPNDAYSYLVQWTFAVSNGCLLSVSFVHAGSLASGNSRSVSELLNLAVSLGLFAGSMVSIPAVHTLSGA